MLARLPLPLPLVHDTEVVAGQPGRRPPAPWCTTPTRWPDNQAVIVSGVMRARLLLPLMHDTDAVAGQPGSDRQWRDAGLPAAAVGARRRGGGRTTLPTTASGVMVACLLLPLMLDADAAAGQPGGDRQHLGARLTSGQLQFGIARLPLPSVLDAAAVAGQPGGDRQPGDAGLARKVRKGGNPRWRLARNNVLRVTFFRQIRLPRTSTEPL